MARFLFSCVGGLTDTKSGTPNIHIKHSAAEGGEPTRREEVPVGGVSMGFLCVAGLTDTKSGTPNIHIKHSAAEGILTPEGAQASRATGFDP